MLVTRFRLSASAHSYEFTTQLCADSHTPSGGGGSDGGNMVDRLATFYVHNIQSHYLLMCPRATEREEHDRARQKTSEHAWMRACTRMCAIASERARPSSTEHAQ